MTTQYFKSKVDWWIYAIVIFTIAVCLVGPAIAGGWIAGVILAAGFTAIELFLFFSIRYAIKGDELGVRMYYHWSWYPIDKIESVKKTSGLLCTAGMSTRRVSIRFCDRNILKSSYPLELSPTDRDAFINALRNINPDIK